MNDDERRKPPDFDASDYSTEGGPVAWGKPPTKALRLYDPKEGGDTMRLLRHDRSAEILRLQEMITRHIEIQTGWSEDDLAAIQEMICELGKEDQVIYGGELLAIARDLGRQLGIKCTTRGQAAFLIGAFLQTPPDDDDDGDPEPEPIPDAGDTVPV